MATKSKQTVKLNSDFIIRLWEGELREEGIRQTRRTDTQPQSWARGAGKQEHHWKGSGMRPCAQRYECKSFRISLIKGAWTRKKMEMKRGRIAKTWLQGQTRKQSGRRCVCTSTWDQLASLVIVLPVDPVFSSHVYYAAWHLWWAGIPFPRAAIKQFSWRLSFNEGAERTRQDASVHRPFPKIIFKLFH